MMKTKLYIVRHAETTGNIDKRLTGRKDYELTENGLASAKKLAKRLSNIKFDKMYSSTSNRTFKTIKSLSDLNNLEIIQMDDLCEMYFGDFDGLKWEDTDEITIDKNETVYSRLTDGINFGEAASITITNIDTISK